MEKIYEVCWDGPYTKDTLDEISEGLRDAPKIISFYFIWYMIWSCYAT